MFRQTAEQKKKRERERKKRDEFRKVRKQARTNFGRSSMDECIFRGVKSFCIDNRLTSMKGIGKTRRRRGRREGRKKLENSLVMTIYMR